MAMGKEIDESLFFGPRNTRDRYFEPAAAAALRRRRLGRRRQ